MKNRFLFGVLAIFMLALIGSVSAADDVFLLSQSGGITPSFSYSFTGGGLSSAPNAFPLSIGQNDKGVGALTVATNVPWTLKARDIMPVGKPAGSGGKMSSMVFGGSYGSVSLTNAMNAKFNLGSYVPLTATDQTIYTGVAMDVTHPVDFRQTVVALDPVLPTNMNYYIVVQLTGAAVP